MSTRVEFGDKTSADAIRDRFAEHLCSDDDKRMKTVTFTSDTPDSVLDVVEAEALESRAEADQRSHTATLTARERDRIKDVDGFDQSTTTLSWESAKGVFAREGLTDKFHDAIPALVDYDSPAEGAEDWIQRNRQGDAERGTKGASGGSRDEGEADLQEQRQAADAARAAQGEQCNHAQDHCQHGDAEACEFLKDACGFDDEEVETLLEDDGDDLPGPLQGARSQLWRRYQIGVANAKEAAAAINEINQQHGEDLVGFEELGDRELTKADIDWSVDA